MTDLYGDRNVLDYTPGGFLDASQYRVLPMSAVAGKGDEAEQANRTESKFNELGSDGLRAKSD